MTDIQHANDPTPDSQRLPGPDFPAEALPEEPRLRRLLGVYEQRQEGLFMQRIRVPGGRLTGRQWHALAAVARQFTPASPLHLTTRQDVEFHDLSAEQVPQVQRALADAGMTGLAACGDTLRNITVCPCSGVAPGSIDLLPLAELVQQELFASRAIFSLPRKFKIAMSCGPACGQPWINDLGLVLAVNAGQPGFKVVGAGSLGPRPATGIVLFEWLAAEGVLPLAVAAVRLFDAHGDRQRRGAARLRHVRQRLGDDVFLRLLREEFEATLKSRVWPAPRLSPRVQGMPGRVDLTFPNGDVSPEAADAIGRLASRPELAVRVAADHRVAVFAASRADSKTATDAEAALGQAATAQPVVIACPGSRWCSRGLVDTVAAAEQVRRAVGSASGDAAEVRISGCPNGCSQNAVAAIGLIGRVATVDGQRQEVFDVLAGGGQGRDARLAELVATVPAARLHETIARLVSDRCRR